MIRSLVSMFTVMLLLTGCMESVPKRISENRGNSFLSDKPKELHGVYSKVVKEGERNRVLYLLRAGLAAMELGYNKLAARSFDQALLTIETVYGGDETAAKARSTFTAEDRKTFRGEPYERAMAFYYRGVLYLMDGDYENARASFKSGNLQDTLAEKEEFRQDFGLLEFLEGWSSQCNGNADLATVSYTLAKKSNTKILLPIKRHNLLVLADLGHAPIKFAEGKHNELLKIKGNAKQGPKSSSVALRGKAAVLRNSESILWQAKTRGGREFDSVLEGKARFKEDMKRVSEAAGTVGQAGLTVGAIGLMTENKNMARAGGIAGVAGGFLSLFTSSISEATKPAADTRQWNNLPQMVAYGTFRYDGSLPELRIQFDRSSANQPIRFGGGKNCKVAWTRSESSVSDMRNAGG